MILRVENSLSIGAIFIALIVVFVAYLNSPLRYTERIMRIGEEKIYVGEYETALSCFNEAYRIGNGKESCIKEINWKLKKIMDYADTSDNPEEILRITDTVISFCEDKYIFGDILIRAESVEDSIHTKQKLEAEKKIAIRIRDLFDKESWDDIVGLLRSESFVDSGKETLDEKLISDNAGMTILVRKVNHGTAVICSESDISINEGYATAIITSEITNALYEGEWQDGHPNGWGRLAIWNSAENSKKATVIIGNFSNGKMNGNMKLSSSDKEGVTLQVENGKIQAINRNEDGEIWTIENIDSISADYIAGVPCFGGSDNKLLVRY